MRPALKAFAFLLLAAAPAAAGGLPGVPSKPGGYVAGYISAGAGVSLPAGGHWGDASSGFKPAPAFSLSISKRADELFSYGLDSFCARSYENRAAGGLDLRLTSLTPFIKVSAPEGGLTYYGILGAGFYRWAYSSFTSGGTVYGPDSGWNGGFNLGGGLLFPLRGNTRAGIELRWHQVLDLRAKAFELGAANSLNLMLIVRGDLRGQRP